MRLPPLNALRAFEAAARHAGFVGAAEELCVTRGAVSHQVKNLEEHLGRELFRRTGHGVELTPDGARLLPVLTDAFGRIRREVDRITTEADTLHILCPPATSIRWLIPRLDRFRQAHPEIGVRLTTDFHRNHGLVRGDCDVGFSVEFWPGRASSLTVEPLFPCWLTPACSPDFLERNGPLGHPGDIVAEMLIHEGPKHADWTAWVQAFGITTLDPNEGNSFPNLDIATKAAVMGSGLVMADLVLCRDELQSGALVTPFPDMICTSPMGAVALIGFRETWTEPRIAAFRDWAKAEAAETAALELPVSAAIRG